MHLYHCQRIIRLIRQGNTQAPAVLLSSSPHVAGELQFSGPQRHFSCNLSQICGEYTVECFDIPFLFNGKLRFKITLPLSISPEEAKAAVLADPMTAKYLQGGTPKKVIVVPSKIINVVV